MTERGTRVVLFANLVSLCQLLSEILRTKELTFGIATQFLGFSSLLLPVLMFSIATNNPAFVFLAGLIHFPAMNFFTSPIQAPLAIATAGR